MDSRIGQLMRNGTTIYYAFVNGFMVESPNVDAVARKLADFDAGRA